MTPGKKVGAQGVNHDRVDIMIMERIEQTKTQRRYIMGNITSEDQNRDSNHLLEDL